MHSSDCAESCLCRRMGTAETTTSTSAFTLPAYAASLWCFGARWEGRLSEFAPGDTRALMSCGCAADAIMTRGCACACDTSWWPMYFMAVYLCSCNLLSYERGLHGEIAVELRQEQRIDIHQHCKACIDHAGMTGSKKAKGCPQRHIHMQAGRQAEVLQRLQRPVGAYQAPPRVLMTMPATLSTCNSTPPSNMKPSIVATTPWTAGSFSKCCKLMTFQYWLHRS